MKINVKFQELDKKKKINRQMVKEGIIIAIITILSFTLAKNFYNDPLLMGGAKLFDIPLYIIISFFTLLYITYRVMCFIIRIIKKPSI